MIDQLIGLILLGLGIKATPFDRYTTTAVKGEQAEIEEAEDTLSGGGKDDEGGTSPSGVRKGKLEELRLKKEALKKEREQFKEAFEKRREEAKETFEASRAAFKENLSAIKDSRKKALLEKISEKCQDINEKRGERMREMLTKMSSILENVANRAETAKTNGKDVTSVETAITNAKTAINAAEEAVKAQAAKVCEISVDSETTAKNDVGKTISSLNNDLRLVHEKVIAAKKAVSSAIRALAIALGESLEKPKITPTSTP